MATTTTSSTSRPSWRCASAATIAAAAPACKKGKYEILVIGDKRCQDCQTDKIVEKIKTEKDCIEHVRDLLTQGGLASDEELKAIDKEIKAVVNESAEFAKESPEPPLGELWTDIYA